MGEREIQRVYLQYRLIPEFSGLGYHTIQYSSFLGIKYEVEFLNTQMPCQTCHDGIENRELKGGIGQTSNVRGNYVVS